MDKYSYTVIFTNGYGRRTTRVIRAPNKQIATDRATKLIRAYNRQHKEDAWLHSIKRATGKSRPPSKKREWVKEGLWWAAQVPLIFSH